MDYKFYNVNEKLPNHRDRVIFSSDGFNSEEAIFLKTYSDYNVDRNNVFLTKSGMYFAVENHPKLKYYWALFPIVHLLINNETK